MEDANPETMTSPLGQVSSKSKLDTLSKDDLIKFAKKQMVAMQKIKFKCADLEKELEVLRSPSDDTVIQELRERMDAVLLEKAETHQSLTSLRKEHEELKRQAHETIEKLTALQDEVHMKNKECADLQTHTTQLTADLQSICGEHESKISQYQRELEGSKRQFTVEMEALTDSQLLRLTESQQEMENLQQEIHRLNRQYEDDVRELEEQLEMNAADFEKERERLLLLHDELSEQLALKEGFLQDVQEEEEDAAAARVIQEDSGIAKVLDFQPSDDSGDEAAMLKSALEDLQSRTVMLQEELTFLRNVKLELESELKQVKHDFTVEKEELEFRINELQMNKDDGDTSVDKTGKRCPISVERRHQNVQTMDGSAEHQEEIHQIRTHPNVDLQEKAQDFITQYQLKKRQTEASLQTLQENLKSVFQERERPLENLSNADGTSELSFEDARRESEDILLQLLQPDTLVEELKEMLDSGWNIRKHQDDDNENLISREKEERIKTLEEDACALRSRDKHLTSQISHLSEERDALQRNMNVSRRQLSEALNRIAEILQQNDSEAEVDVTSDISTLIDHLVTKAKEEKSRLTQQFEERAERLAVDLENARRLGEEQTTELQEHLKDISREKELLKASLHDMLLDTEALQKDLREIQAMNEKLRGENQTLLTQITDFSRSLEEKPREEHTDTQVSDTTQLQQSLAEKHALISQMTEEICRAQTSVSDEDMKVLSHKIEILEKEMKAKDERMNKIKAVAVKAKKELDNSKKEVVALSEEVGMLKDDRDKLSGFMKDIIHGAEDYKNLLVEYDKLSEVLEKGKEKLEQAEQLNEDLSRRLENTSQQHELLSSEREDLMVRTETLRSNVTQLQSHTLELQKMNGGLEKQLEAERLVKEQKAKDHQSAVKDVEELQAQISKLKHQLQQTAQELEQLRKDAQQSTLMDMEMADYEKLVKELNHKLCERDRQIEEYKTQQQTQKEQEQRLNEEIEFLKVKVDQTEEKASKMKQLLVKTKKDLGDAKQKKAEQIVTQSALRGELEAHQQQLEEYKIQHSDLTAEKHRLEEQLKMMNDQQQRSSSSYQLKLNVLQDECTAAKAELAATVSEFESYKVRVHNVLKQQKHKSSKQSDEEAFRQDREHMDGVLERLRRQLQESQQTLHSSTAELQQLHVEHDTLLERHNKILQESVTKEAELRERLLTLQSENMSLKSEHGQCMSHLNAQTEALLNSFREQVRHLQEEHCSTMETLQQHISRLETQLFHMQKESSSSSSGPAVASSRKCQVDRKVIDVPQFDLQGVAREECEGMETTETESASSPGTPLASLEHLLTAPDPKHEPVVWQVELSKEEVTQKLNTATRSMEHLNGLLHETEATNAVLMEQITLLKSEVRRLERNQEREKSVANLEYFKNVLLQFIFLRSGSERQALLPVIHTMLQLSPEEKNKLAAIAQGEEESVSSRGLGWTSYLHSWSGIR
ncbi:GRIP and coiled-coil domain-containing protein 2 isoform X2 [Triplophysa rosa]|uniref:GRIP and coiled-coil domain-containing protein 2-like n=1 Tax=Triplophysa rosa TaxID=992332 RepID=A0A9W7WV28_TRIRA|nr:GRIP and coiled-coil domain-containing protein 2 isoform X2 [Triplophysa rosa]KAI7808741.1 putative GRIP and coiled-coil domain-containing protein 2-like [Triplophysa rosa]